MKRLNRVNCQRVNELTFSVYIPHVSVFYSSVKHLVRHSTRTLNVLTYGLMFRLDNLFWNMTFDNYNQLHLSLHGICANYDWMKIIIIFACRVLCLNVGGFIHITLLIFTR